MSENPEPDIKIEGGVLKVWDYTHKKWNNAGTFENPNGTLYYVTRKREVLRMHNSLGVSEKILKFLLTLDTQPLIMFLLGKLKPYDVYVIPTKVLMESGIPVPCANEGGQISRHLPLDRLIRKEKQLGLGEESV